jgi:hypothetical protein
MKFASNLIVLFIPIIFLAGCEKQEPPEEISPLAVLMDPTSREQIVNELKNDPAVISLNRTLLVTDIDYVRGQEKEIVLEIKNSKENIEKISDKQISKYDQLVADSLKLYGSMPEPKYKVCAGLPSMARETWIMKVKTVREPGPTTQKSFQQVDKTYMEQREECVRFLKPEKKTAE